MYGLGQWKLTVQQTEYCDTPNQKMHSILFEVWNFSDWSDRNRSVYDISPQPSIREMRCTCLVKFTQSSGSCYTWEVCTLFELKRAKLNKFNTIYELSSFSATWVEFFAHLISFSCYKFVFVFSTRLVTKNREKAIECGNTGESKRECESMKVCKFKRHSKILAQPLSHHELWQWNY